MIGMGKQITCPYCGRPGIITECYYGICDVKHEDKVCYVYDIHLNPEDLAGIPRIDFWEDYEEEEEEGVELEELGLEEALEEEALGEEFWEDVERELEDRE